jgi:hypothetical protein
MAQARGLATQRGHWDFDKPVDAKKMFRHARFFSFKIAKKFDSHSAKVPSEVNPLSLPVPHTSAPTHSLEEAPLSSRASTTSPEKSRPEVRGNVTKGSIPKTAAASD